MGTSYQPDKKRLGRGTKKSTAKATTFAQLVKDATENKPQEKQPNISQAKDLCEYAKEQFGKDEKPKEAKERKMPRNYKPSSENTLPNLLGPPWEEE